MKYEIMCIENNLKLSHYKSSKKYYLTHEIQSGL